MKSLTAKHQQGFTLIELMIVIAIIGILASIAIPAYQDFIARAQVSEAVTLLDGLKSGIVDDYTQTGTCPDNTSSATSSGIPLAATITGRYVNKVETGTDAATGNCIATAFMKSSGVAREIQSAKVRLAMDTKTENSISWLCFASVTQKYVPLVCQFKAGL